MDHLHLRLGENWNPRYYRPLLFDSGTNDFHNFPNQPESGIWTVSKDGDYETQQTAIKSNPNAISFNHFLQSWLFFGLLATVLGQPADSLSEDLVVEGYIDTTNLINYLEQWRIDVENMPTDHSRSLRMIRTQIALDKAREVVMDYCSHDGKRRKTVGSAFYVEPKLALSLMVLGETLTNAKAKIVEKVGFNIRGWHGDAMEGWGTPSRVLDKMREKGWCRKLVEILKLQLRSHATALLAAYASHSQTDSETATLIRGHETCTKDKCFFQFLGTDGKYITQHQLTCPRNPNHPDFETHKDDERICRYVGPKVEEVVAIIRKGHVPLLEYNKNNATVTVKECKPYTTYATLSHVWSDGYGNPQKNELWKCQLDYFDDLFTEAHTESRTQDEKKRFWIDTLAVPIQDENKEERRVAVRQIHQVYTNARYTIVIDKGLGQMPATSYESTAMRILASGWMRRLWTLQEAYLSRRLYFAFAGEEGEERPQGRLKNMEDLEDMYPKASDILTSNIPSAARNYFHNLLGNDRRARINELPAGNGTDILASVWRAARWRTTNHQEHETLALATLLNLDYENTKFQDAGLLKKPKVTDEQLQGMMIDLWKLLDKTCPGSIPPGIIFLPGEKLKNPSFGWAPKTWLSNEELEYPDPLSNMVGAARLVPAGLLVQYPGFVLHAQNRASILRENESSFHFPSDSTLLEWYGVEFDIEVRQNPPKGIEKDEKQLAIILCRPKPKETPEIALLVEIEEIIMQRSFSDKHHHSVIYRVSYDRRVKIKRETDQDKLAIWRKYITETIDQDQRNISGDAHGEDKMICGEALDSDQRWYVGGRPSPANIEVKIEDDEPSSVPPQRVATPMQVPVESGTAQPNARTARRNVPIVINSLTGSGRLALATPTYGSSFARPTRTTVPAAQNPLLETSESFTEPEELAVQAPAPRPAPFLISSIGNNQFQNLMSQPAPAPTFPPTPARSRTRSASAVSTSAASNHSATNPVTPENGQPSGNLPTPPGTESPSPRTGRPKPPPPARPSTIVGRLNGTPR